MPRPVTLTARQALNAVQTSKLFIMTLEIVSDEIPATDLFPAGVMRMCSDSVIFNNAEGDWHPYPFDLAMPNHDPEAPPTAVLTVDNIAREIVMAVRSIREAPVITYGVRLYDFPNAYEAGPYSMYLTGVSYDRMVVQGQLGLDNILNELFPKHTMSPVAFPGLYPQ